VSETAILLQEITERLEIACFPHHEITVRSDHIMLDYTKCSTVVVFIDLACEGGYPCIRVARHSDAYDSTTDYFPLDDFGLSCAVLFAVQASMPRYGTVYWLIVVAMFLCIGWGSLSIVAYLRSGLVR
jgi:hypothetical protein